MDIAMVELLFMAQLGRNPVQALARRWWGRSLYRASRGERRGEEREREDECESGHEEPFLPGDGERVQCIARFGAA